TVAPAVRRQPGGALQERVRRGPASAPSRDEDVDLPFGGELPQPVQPQRGEAGEQCARAGVAECGEPAIADRRGPRGREYDAGQETRQGGRKSAGRRAVAEDPGQFGRADDARATADEGAQGLVVDLGAERDLGMVTDGGGAVSGSHRPSVTCFASPREIRRRCLVDSAELWTTRGQRR